jgi:hypothetical protein
MAEVYGTAHERRREGEKVRHTPGEDEQPDRMRGIIDIRMA